MRPEPTIVWQAREFTPEHKASLKAAWTPERRQAAAERCRKQRPRLGTGERKKKARYE